MAWQLHAPTAWQSFANQGGKYYLNGMAVINNYAWQFHVNWCGKFHVVANPRSRSCFLFESTWKSTDSLWRVSLDPPWVSEIAHILKLFSDLTWQTDLVNLPWKQKLLLSPVLLMAGGQTRNCMSL